MDLYREKLLDNYQNPRNFGKLESASASEAAENISCGDAITLYLKVSGGKIADVSFEGEGCAIAIAAGSILTEHVKGKNVSEVKKIDLEKLMSLMGVQLTPSRLKCADLSLEALKKALNKLTSLS